MNSNRRRILGHAMAAGLSTLPALSALPLSALAQAQFPARPVKIVVPFATGGASDTFARTVGVNEGSKAAGGDIGVGINVPVGTGL